MKIDYYKKYKKYKYKYLELKGAGFEHIAYERRKHPTVLKNEFKYKLQQVKNNKLEDTPEENILDFNNIKNNIEINYKKYVNILSPNNLLLSNIYDILNNIFNSDIKQNIKIIQIYGYLYFLELYYNNITISELDKKILDIKHIKEDIKHNYKRFSDKLTLENLLLSNIEYIVSKILKNHLNNEDKVIMIYRYINLLEIYYNKINTY
jgi:hypothetical protein